MNTLVIGLLIVLGVGLILWKLDSVCSRIVDAIDGDGLLIEKLNHEGIELEEEDADELREAVGESAGVPLIIGVMRRSGQHYEVECEICQNTQCVECNGRACTKCGVEIKGQGTPVDP